MATPTAEDEPYPFEDYVQFKKEALRLNKLSQKGQEFLALLQREQDREGGARELPCTHGVNILHELVHFNAPMIDWGDDFLASVKKILEIWPHAAGKICPADKEYPLHTYFMSGLNERFELVDDVVYALVDAYPEALTKQCLPIMETPLHIICRCVVGYDGVDEPLINYILEKDPSAAAIKDSKGRYPLHSLMLTDPVETVDTARPIYEAFPEAMSTPDNDGNYPLHLALDRDRCDCDDTMGFVCSEYPQAAAIRNNDNDTPIAIRVKREGEADDTRITMMVRDSADLNKAYSDYGLDDRLPTEDGTSLDNSISDLAWSDEDPANTVKVDLDDEDTVQIRVIPTFTSGGSSTEFAFCRDVTPKTYFCHRSVLGDESRERCAMYFTAMLNSSFAEASESQIKIHLHPDAAAVFPILLDGIYYGKCDTSPENICAFLNLCKYLRFRWGNDTALANLHYILCQCLEKDNPVEICCNLMVGCFVNGLENALGAILGCHIKFIMKYYEEEEPWETEPSPYSYFNSYKLELFLPLVQSLPIKWLPWNNKIVISYVRNSREMDWDNFLACVSPAVLPKFHHTAAIGILICAMWKKAYGVAVDKELTHKELCKLTERCIEPIDCDHQALVRIAATDEEISTYAALKLLGELEKICSRQ